MASDLAWKTLNAVHRAVLSVSGGRIGWRAGGMPAVELTTTGRRSGRPHTVMLTSPLQDGDTIVVVASRGGDDHHPAWLLNLRDDPDVEAAYNGGPKKPMKARIADADERARLWPQVIAGQPRYAGYQGRANREIPLVLLQPAD